MTELITRANWWREFFFFNYYISFFAKLIIIFLFFWLRWEIADMLFKKEVLISKYSQIYKKLSIVTFLLRNYKYSSRIKLVPSNTLMVEWYWHLSVTFMPKARSLSLKHHSHPVVQLYNRKRSFTDFSSFFFGKICIIWWNFKSYFWHSPVDIWGHFI